MAAGSGCGRRVVAGSTALVPTPVRTGSGSRGRPRVGPLSRTNRLPPVDEPLCARRPDMARPGQGKRIPAYPRESSNGVRGLVGVPDRDVMAAAVVRTARVPGRAPGRAPERDRFDRSRQSPWIPAFEHVKKSGVSAPNRWPPSDRRHPSPVIPAIEAEVGMARALVGELLDAEHLRLECRADGVEQPRKRPVSTAPRLPRPKRVSARDRRSTPPPPPLVSRSFPPSPRCRRVWSIMQAPSAMALAWSYAIRSRSPTRTRLRRSPCLPYRRSEAARRFGTVSSYGRRTLPLLPEKRACRGGDATQAVARMRNAD